jgi:hypothetical protein
LDLKLFADLNDFCYFRVLLSFEAFLSVSTIARGFEGGNIWDWFTSELPKPQLSKLASAGF